METCAPLKTAPAGSVSDPEMDPPWSWAGTGVASPQSNRDRNCKKVHGVRATAVRCMTSPSTRKRINVLLGNGTMFCGVYQPGGQNEQTDPQTANELQQ